MSKPALVAIVLLLTPLAAYCQDKVPIHKIRLGGIINSTTTYKGSRPGVKEMKTTYKRHTGQPKADMRNGRLHCDPLHTYYCPKG